MSPQSRRVTRLLRHLAGTESKPTGRKARGQRSNKGKTLPVFDSRLASAVVAAAGLDAAEKLTRARLDDAEQRARERREARSHSFEDARQRRDLLAKLRQTEVQLAGQAAEAESLRALAKPAAERLSLELQTNQGLLQSLTGLRSFNVVVRLLEVVKAAGCPPWPPNARLLELQSFLAFLAMFHHLHGQQTVAGYLFGTSQSTMHRSYMHWLQAVAAVVPTAMPWPTYAEALAVTLPHVQSLLMLRPDTCVFYGDCVEISICRSKSITFDRATFSTYKAEHTVKYLVIIAANGCACRSQRVGSSPLWTPVSFLHLVPPLLHQAGTLPTFLLRTQGRRQMLPSTSPSKSPRA